VERSAVLGGSARYAGYLHTATSASELQAADPAANPALQDQLVSGFSDAVAWVRALGVDCGPERAVVRLTRGHQIDTNGYINACAAAITGAPDSSIRAQTTTSRLVTGDGAVVGAEVATADGGALQIDARFTLMATGGFQGDPSLVAEHIHPQGPLMPLRSNPVSRGDGLRLAADAGAAVGPPAAMFYGHLVPFGVPLGDPSGFAAISQYHSDHGLLFNLHGERFVDETHGDHVNTVFVVEQPEARALLVIDSRVRQRWMLTPLVEGMPPPADRFELGLKRGGRAAVAHDLDEFEYLPEEWGYPGRAIRDGIRAFNTAAEAGRPIQPTRHFDPEPLLDPPYYVMDVAPAITFSYPGLLIDRHARALDVEHQPIPGLLAAGADAGGTFAREYAGGLANAVVFGIQAAKTACGLSDT
jgi:succinate dehydrogenase/fumarate reductase flavoprotein subunit